MIEEITKATEQEIQDEMKEIKTLWESLQKDLKKKWDEIQEYVAKINDDMALLDERYTELNNELEKRKKK